jgi:hypothetical protein
MSRRRAGEKSGDAFTSEIFRFSRSMTSASSRPGTRVNRCRAVRPEEGKLAKSSKGSGRAGQKPPIVWAEGTGCPALLIAASSCQSAS